MGYAFDPEATRQQLLEDHLGLDWELNNVLESARQELNLLYWRNVLRDVIRARIVGLGDDPRVVRMLDTLLDVLGPLDWPEQRRLAVSEKPGPGVSLDRMRANRLNLVMGGATALALGRWLRTGEPQTELFSEAYEAARGSFDATYGNKTKWRLGDIANVVALGCAGHRFPQVLSLFEHPALADYRTLDLPKARSTLELGYAIAQHRARGTVSTEELGALCERTLRREVVTAIELLIDELARLAYLVGMVRTGGDPRALLDRIIEYVGYLSKAKATPKRATTARARPAPPPAPAATGPLPPIQISSSSTETGIDPTARVILVTQSGQEWKQLDDGRWALRVASSHDTKALADPRWPEVVELAAENPELLTSPALTKLARATADGHTLSALAARETLCALEVAFPRAVGNWIDGAMVQVNPPLTRGIWHQALAVGTLTNLRAVSFHAEETDKERIARGTQPYTVGPDWFWSSPLAQQLEAVNVAAELHPLAGWRARFAELPRLARVYLRVWVRQREMPWRRPLRVVIDRADAGMRLTLQSTVSLLVLLPDDLAALLDRARDDVAAIDVERIGGDLTDEATTAELLGAYATVGEFRGNARLAEL